MAKVAIQGGVKNYLPSREVTVPVEAKSSKNHVKAHLAYITDKEQKLLIEKNLHGSLKGKPNRGPGGLPSLQGSFGDKDGKSGNVSGPGFGDVGPNDTVGGRDTSAFRDSGTGNYNLSNRLSDRQAVIDYAKGNMGFQKGKKPSFFGGPGSLKQRRQIYNARRNIANIERLQKTRMNKLQQGLMTGNIPGIDTMTMQEMIDLAPSMKSFGYTNKTINDILSGKRANIDFAVPSGLPSIAGMVTNQLGKVMSGPVTREKLNELYGEYNDLGELNPAAQTTFGLMEKYEPNRYAREFGPPVGGEGNGQQSYLPIDPNTGAAETVEPYTSPFPYRFGDTQGVGDDVTKGFYAAKGGRAGKAEGGIMGTRARRAMGGIMNRIDQRQGYGFGSIVKSITKPFKSVAKAAGKVLSSDIGKAALAGAAFYYGGGGNLFGLQRAGATGFGSTGFGAFAKGLGQKALLKGGTGPFTLGNLSLGKLGILGASALPFLMPKAKPNETSFSDRGGSLIDPITGLPAKPAEMRASLNNALENADGDPDRIKQINDAYAFLGPDERLGTYLPYRTYGAANGGRIGYSLGNLVKGSSIVQPASASMSAGDAPSFEKGTGMGGMIADLIRKNPNMFKRSKNSTPINQNNDGMYSKMFNNSQLFNQLSNNNDFIDENMNGIDDREEMIMANGGRIGKAEGGLMDLGGMEKDYRSEGGFVPIGEYEKKDDVPARLSVNEFVFTADAVRGAGQGDIDKGAEIMENMMKNLENGGTVSEESQGNKGAQQMFETSERLGAII